MSSKRFRFLFGIFLLGTLSSLCVAEDCGGKRCPGSCCGDGLSECCLDSLNSFNSFTIKTYGEKEDHDLKVADNSSFEAHRRQFFILFIVLFCLSILICIIFGVLNYFYWERGRMVRHLLTPLFLVRCSLGHLSQLSIQLNIQIQRDIHRSYTRKTRSGLHNTAVVFKLQT
uniref:Uncharacterized protein n=1 Tax=Biomphalaria glabrata TaxID=6526 RepID=A0A2C9K5V5_BIOGL